MTVQGGLCFSPLLVVGLLLGIQHAGAYYVPGVTRRGFTSGEEVQLNVNKLTSVHELFPLEYYRLPFCRPDTGVKRKRENLGQLLAGDRIQNSPYKLMMKTDMYCEQLCLVNGGHMETQGMSPNKLARAIKRGYHNNWIVDNLPAASKAQNDDIITTRYWQGFPIGYVDESTGKSYVNNHVNIEISYHATETEGKYTVVRFVVQPFSIAHNFDYSSGANESFEGVDYYLPKVAIIKNPIDSCNPKKKSAHTDYAMIAAADHKPQVASEVILFTYDVIWKEDKEVRWASRWDIYLNMDGAVPARVHWISIANSLVIVCFLSAVIVTILIRNLRRDINRYNSVGTDEEARAEELEESSWKLVHADVFRPPTFSPMLLSVASGTGAQLLLMSLFTIFFSTLGFLSPARRGHLLIAELALYIVMGSVNGYVAARLYKSFKGKAWQRATTTTAVAFPGLCFLTFLVLNVVASFKKSTNAVPFFTILTLVILWFGIATPLCFVGAYFGYRQDAIEFPVETSSIPRQIPEQPWFMGVPFTLLIGGILPFGACFVELFYVMSAVWMEYYYYVFGFLFIVFLILIITCAEVTVLFTYQQLCREDYHWWWRSFCNAGSTAIYVFLYSIVYFGSLDPSSLATCVLYFGYMGLVSLGLFCMLGFIGLSTSLWFNTTIFNSIRIE